VSDERIALHVPRAHVARALEIRPEALHRNAQPRLGRRDANLLVQRVGCFARHADDPEGNDEPGNQRDHHLDEREATRPRAAHGEGTVAGDGAHWSGFFRMAPV
jgi:hypothetical protein